MDDIEATLRHCFKAVFPELSDDEIPLASTASVGGWDSVAALSLMMLVEEQLQIRVPTDMMPDFVSYELILDFIKNAKNVS